MVINTNLTWSIAIEILFLKLPGYLTLALPMATLLGCLLAFSQLYNNSEIKAIKKPLEIEANIIAVTVSKADSGATSVSNKFP